MHTIVARNATIPLPHRFVPLTRRTLPGIPTSRNVDDDVFVRAHSPIATCDDDDDARAGRGVGARCRIRVARRRRDRNHRGIATLGRSSLRRLSCR